MNILFLTLVLLSAARAMTLRSMDFEVFGRVQGVFFRKSTKEQADKLGIRGWCKNTAAGTVLGHIEGPQEKVNEMVDWLKTKGSPSSQIDKAEFKNAKDITELTTQSFTIIYLFIYLFTYHGEPTVTISE